MPKQDYTQYHVYLPNGKLDPESVRKPPGQHHTAKRQQRGYMGGEEFCAPCSSAIYDGDFDRIGTPAWLNDGFENCEHLDKPLLYCCLCKHILRAKELARRCEGDKITSISYNGDLQWHLSSMEAGIFVHDDRVDLDGDDTGLLEGFEVEKCFYTRSISLDWASISMINRWLSDCETQHDQMCNAHRTGMLSETSSLTLVDVEDNCLVQGHFKDRYFALSYVWGASKQFLTLLANYQSLLQQGSLMSRPLTQTIRDSMTFVKSLGERYLWVDTVVRLRFIV